MKPYQRVPIEECGEPLVAIPLEKFAVVTPHPYAALGAPYGSFSPYFLRQGVVTHLLQAQAHLHQQRPGWRLQIFDAYRPIPVQQFMVDYTFEQLARAEGLEPAQLSNEVRSRLQAKVIEFWAQPSHNPKQPPPHSTGAAVDLTLLDAQGNGVDMGSAIDEISPRSYPDYFAESNRFDEEGGAIAAQYHHHRHLLHSAMSAAGFRQHPNEWWHFSLGDQLWAWQVGNGANGKNDGNGGHGTVAKYGNAQAV